MQQESLNLSLESAKRKKNERSGVHRWHPYYAGYSESFVQSAIRYLGLKENDLVLDPWNGSGTTSLVCSRNGIASVGLDVNPVMNHFSNAKNGVLFSMEVQLKSELEKVCARALKTSIDVGADDPLHEWSSHTLVNALRRLQSSIEEMQAPEITIHKSIVRAMKSENSINSISPVKSLFQAALFIVARELAGYGGGSNPTWTRASETKADVRIGKLLEAFSNKVSQMLRDMAEASVQPTDKLLQGALLGDSRRVPLKASSVDGIITSPPYLTRIDYAMSTQPELLLIGDPTVLRKTRENTMGAPVIVDKNISPSPNWGKLCLSLLKYVSEHPSKAAKSYYYPNMLQYFRDAELSLNEILRVLKPKARALIVVQSSYFKEHEIGLGDIYVQMAKKAGVRASIPYREVVKGHMAHINTRSNQYTGQKVYYEDVVEVQKS